MHTVKQRALSLSAAAALALTLAACGANTAQTGSESSGGEEQTLVLSQDQVTLDGQVINAGGSFTGGSVQRSAGLFTRKQEIEQLHSQIARLEKDYAAAQDRTDECKAQADALAAELTATSSEQITAGGDRVRAEAEQKRLAAALAEARETARQRDEEIAALGQAQ